MRYLGTSFHLIQTICPRRLLALVSYIGCCGSAFHPTPSILPSFQSTHPAAVATIQHPVCLETPPSMKHGVVRVSCMASLTQRRQTGLAGRWCPMQSTRPLIAFLMTAESWVALFVTESSAASAVSAVASSSGPVSPGIKSISPSTSARSLRYAGPGRS